MFLIFSIGNRRVKASVTLSTSCCKHLLTEFTVNEGFGSTDLSSDLECFYGVYFYVLLFVVNEYSI